MAVQAGDGKRWVWAISAGAVVVVALAMVVRVPERVENITHAQNHTGAAVGIARFDGGTTNAILMEEAMLRDPLPLFLPTEWSASAEVLRADAWREPQTAFQDFPAKLHFGEARLALEIPAEVPVPTRAGEAFEVEHSRRPFAGFGQTGGDLDALPARTAFLEVVAAGDGQRVISQPLVNAAPPGDVPWQPLEFLVAVDVGGVMGSPVLTESSSVAAVDGYFEDYIVKVLHLGERLGPGFYHVGIGP